MPWPYGLLLPNTYGPPWGSYRKKPASGITGEWLKMDSYYFRIGSWRGRKWNVSQKGDVDPFVKLMRKLFSRYTHMPLIARRYSVESAARYVFALFSFGILISYVGSCHLLFWHGDIPEQPNTEHGEYRNLRTRRSEVLRNLAQSEERRAALVVPNISALPRWNYARRLAISKGELNPIPESGSGAYLGLGGYYPTHRKYSDAAIFTRSPLSIVAQYVDLIGYIDGVLGSYHSSTSSRRIFPTMGQFGALSAAPFHQRELRTYSKSLRAAKILVLAIKYDLF